MKSNRMGIIVFVLMCLYRYSTCGDIIVPKQSDIEAVITISRIDKKDQKGHIVVTLKNRSNDYIFCGVPNINTDFLSRIVKTNANEGGRLPGPFERVILKPHGAMSWDADLVIPVLIGKGKCPFEWSMISYIADESGKAKYGQATDIVIKGEITIK